MNNVNYYNNEIGKCFSKIQAELSKPISDEYRKKLDLVASDISKMLKEYNDIQNYINKVLNTNYFFRSIHDMSHCISSSMKSLNLYDIRITNLQSVLIPIRNLNEKFCKARNYAEIIIKECDKSINTNSMNYNNKNINSNFNNSNHNTNNNSNINYNNQNINSNNGNINNNNQGKNAYYNIHQNNLKVNEGAENEGAYKIIYILGIIMILIGVSIFGKYVYVNYLNNLVKGMLLFGVGVIIILLSELLLKRKNVNFSRGVTIMGLCELYISIMINAIGLHNINELIAFILIFLLSASTIFYSFTVKSVAFRYFAHGAGLVSFLFFIDIIQKDLNSSLLVAVYIIILNVLNVVLPIRNYNNYLSAFSIYTFVINCLITIFLLVSLSCEVFVGVCVFYVVLSLLMDTFILKKLHDNDVANIFNNIFLVFTSMASVFVNGNNILSQNIIFFIGIIICIVCAILSKGMKKYKYLIPAIIFALEVVYNIPIEDSNIKHVLVYFVLGILILLLGCIKVTSRSKLINIFMNISIIFMGIKLFITCSDVRTEIDSYFCLFDLFLAFITIAGVMICHVIYKEKDTPSFSVLKYYSFALIIPVAIEINYLVNEHVTLLVICIMCLIAMVIYSNIKYLRNQNYKTDNILIAFGIIIISIALLLKNTSKVTFIDIISLSICFITLTIFTKNKYNDVFVSYSSRMIFLNIVGLTYLVTFCLKTFDKGQYITLIIIDILFMILACFDVIRGFANRCKSIRILGITIALVTCIKVPLLDCIGMNAIQKTLIFIGVGIISMILAYVYSSYVRKNSNLK